MMTAETQRRKTAEGALLDAIVNAGFAYWGTGKTEVNLKFNNQNDAAKFLGMVNSYLDLCDRFGRG